MSRAKVTGWCFKMKPVLRDLPLPNLLGAHQIQNAGVALAALRQLALGDAACEAAVTSAEWPARMQRVKTGPLAQIVNPVWNFGSMAVTTPQRGRQLARPLKSFAQAFDTSDLRHAENKGHHRLSCDQWPASPIACSRCRSLEKQPHYQQKKPPGFQMKCGVARANSRSPFQKHWT